MKYRVTHRTTYTYSGPVQDSVGLLHLVPRSLPWQHVGSNTITLDPCASDVNSDIDYFGNSVMYFQITDSHTVLGIEAVSDVEVAPPSYGQAALSAPWEDARPLQNRSAGSAWSVTEYALESPRAAHLAGATAYAALSLTPGRPIGEAVTDLMQRIHADFAYDSTATTVTSTVAEVFRKRAGVCQDFAHFAIACLRGHGIAARYVSGYLATQPPPGKERVVGADASHAWVSVWLPGTNEWLAFDPTNNQWAGDRYVTVAWGRDYGDVSPVRGIIFTEAKKSTLRVSVDVSPQIDDAAVYSRTVST